jgi:outer membrane protein insertion porin family
MDRSTLRSSAGLAVNVLTPIGPLSFSFSEALSKSSSDKTETFRFNLGTTF